ncbi:MAG: cell division protein, partial [Cyclobacteriaceae bacterium]|nr:cell division protein [Cyclobacteriaceae bacterium]
ESPLGILGDAVDILFLKGYLTRLLEQRNETLKSYAETDKWMEILPVSMDEPSIVC